MLCSTTVYQMKKIAGTLNSEIKVVDVCGVCDKYAFKPGDKNCGNRRCKVARPTAGVKRQFVLVDICNRLKRMYAIPVGFVLFC